MSQPLSRWQAVVLGFVVVVSLALGVYGITRIAERQGLLAHTVELIAGFPEVHDIGPGTVVRLRGVDVGQVVGIEYPDHDGPGAEVIVRMRIAGKYADRIYADATAQIHSSSLLGAKVVSINPGSPARGRLEHGRLTGLRPLGSDDAVAVAHNMTHQVVNTAEEFRRLASQTNDLIKDLRESHGTLMQLVKDDALHRDLKALVVRTDRAVDTLETQVSGLGGLISDGRETLRSLKLGADALNRLPIIRNYVEDAAAILVHPGAKRDMWYYSTNDLFEPGTSNLHYDGQVRLNDLANVIKENRNKNSEIVVVSFVDPADKSQTPGSALELSRKQAERVVEHLKVCNVHKLGTFTRRKMTALGMGMNPSPVVEPNPLPPSVVQIMVFNH